MIWGCSYVSLFEFFVIYELECFCGLVECLNGNCFFFVLREDLVKYLEGCGFCVKECLKGCGILMVICDDNEYNCIYELKIVMDILCFEMFCKIDE